MRSGLAMVGGWLVVTGVAVGVAVGAVGLVSDSMTADRPRALSAAAVSAALAEARAPSSAGETSTTVTSGASVTTATTRPATTATTRPETTGTTRPGPTATTLATTNPTATTVGTAPTATTVATGPATAAPEERTYRLQGGQARIRFTPSGATIVSASPEPGFTMEQKQHDGGEVEVRFRSDDHESRLRAFWENGPQAEIDED